MKVRRSKFVAIVAAIALAASTVGLAAPAAAVECTPCGTPVVVDLLAGQTMKVGTVTIANSAEFLCVTYDITEKDWLIYETHTEAKPSWSAIPQDGKKNPAPGQFRYPQSFPEGVSTWTERIPLADIPAVGGADIAVATHAVVKSGDMMPVDAFDALDGIKYWATDTATKGDWQGEFAPVSSPLGRYGDCAYILPDPPTNTSEVPAGSFTAPVGFFSSDGSTYSKLAAAPYAWTSSQYNSLDRYKPDSPYWDEFGGKDLFLGAGFDYSLSGTYMGLNPDPRPLLNEIGGQLYSRATCGFLGSTINMQMWVPAGSHQLSLYLLDYDSVGREETVTVSAPGGDRESVLTTNFSGGVYQQFYVYMPTAGYVDVQLVKKTGANAVISGAFLDPIENDVPVDAAVADVAYMGIDAVTKGDWINAGYGDEAGLKCAWYVGNDLLPAQSSLAWNKLNDHSWTADPAVSWDYSVATGSQYAWTGMTAFVSGIQYPVFEWAWGNGTATRPSDPRAAYYPAKDYWRLACWDDGGERKQPTNGYEDFNLHFPEGSYVLSLYAYDYERTRVGQQYKIFDAGDMSTPLAEAIIDGTEFDEGAYKLFTVQAPAGGRDIVARVYNNVGYPTSLNVLLSGVFVDCVRSVKDETAWGAGARFTQKGNWATWTAYKVVDCAPQLIETINVPANNPTGLVSSTSLEAGKTYVVEVGGTWQFHSGWAALQSEAWPELGRADAEYSCRMPNVGAPNTQIAWVSGDDLLAGWTHYLEMKINGNQVDWGVFNPEHVYSTQVVGTGTPITMGIIDNYYPDNLGSLTVKLYELP